MRWHDCSTATDGEQGNNVRVEDQPLICISLLMVCCLAFMTHPSLEASQLEHPTGAVAQSLLFASWGLTLRPTASLL